MSCKINKFADMLKRFLLILVLAVSLGGSVGVYAQKFTVKVVGISDGDTFTGLNRDKLQIKFRINGIDAPEKGQDFGNKARQALSDYIFNKEITVDVQSQDGWGRYIAFVYTPDGKDVSLLMLQAGMAWHFKKYDATEAYARAEEQARARKAGLWSMPAPEAPWDYRASRRNP